MNTKSHLIPHLSFQLTEKSRSQLKLLLFAVASALLPYALATLLIVVGPSL